MCREEPVGNEAAGAEPDPEQGAPGASADEGSAGEVAREHAEALEGLAGDDLGLLGAFHRLNSAVPEVQVVLSVPPETAVGEALQIMDREGFSQLPVVRGTAVLGSFSYRSLARGAVQYAGRTALSDLPVEEFLESLETAHATEELQSVFDALDADHAVIVGTIDDLQALLTPMDVLRYLYRVAEPYVQLGEIERSLRRIVRESTSEEELAACAARTLAREYVGREDDIPVAVSKMTLGELVSIVRDGRNYEHFSGFLGQQRESASARLGLLPTLRNDVFHFLRELSDDDRSKIAEARNWLLRRLRGRGDQQ